MSTETQNYLQVHYIMNFCLHLQLFVYIIWHISSPSEGPCCTDQCDFTNEVECGHEDECRFSVMCDGTSSFCPIALHKSDTSPCEGGSKVSLIVALCPKNFQNVRLRLDFVEIR